MGLPQAVPCRRKGDPMLLVRPSVPEDVPAQRELWKLAFGDSDPYIDNFYNSYYRPGQVVVLEEDGLVRSMTAWFDTTFVVPGQGEYRAAYLYAVATHPDCRGQGLAGKLLAGADEYFRSLNIPAVTTVPAEPSLHDFFLSFGFRECFTYSQAAPGEDEELLCPFALKPVDAKQYARLRAAILAEIPHIAYPPDALEYQQGCCRLSGGGLYLAETAKGTALLCSEGLENGRMLVKELVACPQAQAQVLACLNKQLPGCAAVRTPGPDVKFGMLKWLSPELERAWDWKSTGYLGLAFD